MDRDPNASSPDAESERAQPAPLIWVRKKKPEPLPKSRIPRLSKLLPSRPPLLHR